MLNAVFFGFIILNQFEAISSRPLITSLQDTIYPVKFVPFPAVVICPNNRISRKAARDLAQKLAEKDPKHREASFFMDSLHFLGSLYDSETENEYPLLEFQEFLEQNYLLNSTDVTDILRDLSPDCDELSISCHWQGQQRPCMVSNENDTAILRRRRTQYGFCCSFNYNRLDNFSMAYGFLSYYYS